MSLDHLRLTHWLSPAFPTGAYAHSQGLEWALGPGGIRDAAGVQDWLAVMLRQGSGWQDAVLLSLALEPGADVQRLAELARALAPSSGRLREMTDQGRAFGLTLTAMGEAAGEAAVPGLPLPVAVGQAARGLDLPKPLVIAHYLQGWALNLATIAVRAVPLGQSEGQRIVRALQPAMLKLAERAALAGEDDLGTASFGADLAGMLQESMDVRIYRT
jgi:urease accessory protein